MLGRMAAVLIGVGLVEACVGAFAPHPVWWAAGIAALLPALMLAVALRPLPRV